MLKSIVPSNGRISSEAITEAQLEMYRVTRALRLLTHTLNPRGPMHAADATPSDPDVIVAAAEILAQISSDLERLCDPISQAADALAAYQRKAVA